MKSVGIPLILTFKIDDASQRRLDGWRGQFFPKERNYLKAHLTIFHQLPGQEISAIQKHIEEFISDKKPFRIDFDRLMTKQGFVGVGVSSEPLHDMRVQLTERLAKVLRTQDKQPYRPHITIANLGSPREAAICYAELGEVFVPWSGDVLGLELYHYRGGPWELSRVFLFS